MEIRQEKDGSKLTVFLSGSLNTQTAPDLSDTLAAALEGVTNLTIDLKDLVYISSAGLRVLLSTDKKMNACSGSLTVRNAGPAIMEVFDMTGFSGILKLE